MRKLGFLLGALAALVALANTARAQKMDLRKSAGDRSACGAAV